MRMATPAMGTRFELALVASTPASLLHLRAVGELALQEIGDWHQRLTRFSADSWVSHVNRTASNEPAMLDDDLWGLMQDATTVWVESEGAFDVTRGRGGDLRLDTNTRSLRFLRPGPSLDLGAIGKGHALDCAAACLRRHGVTRAFLQGGTSSGLALGYDPDRRPWRVQVDDEVIELVDAAFSVSDNGSQPDAPDGRHIVDPRRSDVSLDQTRPRPQVRRRAVVSGPSARLADAWSTAIVVLGTVPPRFPSAYDARFLRSDS